MTTTAEPSLTNSGRRERPPGRANDEDATAAHRLLFAAAAASAGAAAALTAITLQLQPALLLAWLIVPVTIAAAVIDARTGLIPNALTAPLAAGTAAYVLVVAPFDGNLLTAALAGAAVSAILHGALWFTGGYGGGDLKLSIILTAAAATLGLIPAAIAMAAPALLLLPLLLKRRIQRKPDTSTRLGPYLAAGLILAVIAAIAL
ncbi:A24 family peptidase [Agrococcus casei]|uniref:Putative type IV peptidase n=1 Tax=Agrococcus casei LMG 22410 TaxID=1255656 RepID=A0A1R4FJ36_9MICO|nr:A24 family peptidase [Agrococcus casei]SJM55955.1 putative type IV peptidase [Agrococcus casei LMG 22410]